MRGRDKIASLHHTRNPEEAMSTSSTSRVTVRILWNPVCVMGATSHKPQQMKWEATLQPARREDSHNVVRQPAHSDSTPNIKAVVRSHMRDPTTATIADENRSCVKSAGARTTGIVLK